MLVSLFLVFLLCVFGVFLILFCCIFHLLLVLFVHFAVLLLSILVVHHSFLYWLLVIKHMKMLVSLFLVFSLGVWCVYNLVLLFYFFLFGCVFLCIVLVIHPFYWLLITHHMQCWCHCSWCFCLVFSVLLIIFVAFFVPSLLFCWFIDWMHCFGSLSFYLDCPFW